MSTSKIIGLGLASVILAAGIARAEPGLSEAVYGAVVDEGRKELELRYGGE